jgi:two-component system, cell cycle sensor histidine kinase and response regulator CckA
MKDDPGNRLPRILIVDDNAAIHSDFRKTLGSQPAKETQLDDLEQSLFGGTVTPVARSGFRIDSALQGQEALAMVQRALAEDDPYVLAFVDIRMPPGWDGVETLERLWECSPELQAVICTAYSDYSWDDISRRLGQTDNLLILKKPFDTAEVLQVAHALTQKWVLGRQARLRMEDLDQMVRERTHELQQEVEERTRVQEALRVSEERFAKAFLASPMPMAIQSDADGLFLDANPSFLQLAGYSADQLILHKEHELRLWDGRAAQPAGAGHQAPVQIRNQACTLRCSDGTTRSTVLWVEPITLETGPCRLVIVEDTTDRLKLEAQLRQAQKLEAVGCLAAGIAHEFNNLLTVIQGHTDLLIGKPLGTRATGESLTRIAQASARAASLTRRLLAFSHKQAVEFKPIQLSAAVQGLTKMLGQLIGETYQLCLNCAAGLPAIRADEANVEQILINLAVNARDAMPDGGIIQVTTSLAVFDEASARESLEARPGQFVCLAVSDSGCGMSPEVLGRIFDPFYTTKEVGKGTGLGLSTVHGIVRQHAGWIEVASQPGQGATFKVFLPVWEGACGAAPAVEAAGSPSLHSASGEAVLIVEDEGIVREAARLILERGGYRVFEAGDGPEALAIWERSPVRIDLLVTDMVMPRGVSGGALARVLQSRDPHLRALYTSGYSSEVVREDLRLTQGVNFLRKPYAPPALLEAVRTCLDRDAQAQDHARNPAQTDNSVPSGHQPPNVKVPRIMKA